MKNDLTNAEEALLGNHFLSHPLLSLLYNGKMLVFQQLCTQGLQSQDYHRNEPVYFVDTSAGRNIYTNHGEYIVENVSRFSDAAAETLQPETSQWFADLCPLTPLLHYSTLSATRLADTLELTFADLMECLNDFPISIVAVYEYGIAYLSTLRGRSKYLNFCIDDKQEIAMHSCCEICLYNALCLNSGKLPDSSTTFALLLRKSYTCAPGEDWSFNKVCLRILHWLLGAKWKSLVFFLLLVS